MCLCYLPDHCFTSSVANCTNAATTDPVKCRLLHRNRFGQIPRLIHVSPPRGRRVIREQLQWHDVQDRRQHAIVFGQANHVQAFA